MFLKRSAGARVDVRIHTLPWYGWPLWFSNDIMDSQVLAPISDQLKSESLEMRDYITENSTWDDSTTQYRWKDENHRREFNRVFDAYVLKLETELGGGYRVIAEYSRKNKENYVQLVRKKSSLFDRLRQHRANK